MRRPSATIARHRGEIAVTSTTSDTAFAICVPEPWAIESLAAFSAGTSLTPSPTIATYRPRCRSASTTRRLPSGEMRPTTETSSTTAVELGIPGRKSVAADRLGVRT